MENEAELGLAELKVSLAMARLSGKKHLSFTDFGAELGQDSKGVMLTVWPKYRADVISESYNRDQQLAERNMAISDTIGQFKTLLASHVVEKNKTGADHRDEESEKLDIHFRFSNLQALQEKLLLIAPEIAPVRGL